MYAKLGQMPQARVLLEQAVDDLQALGIRANEPALPHNLSRLARVLYQQGEYAAAEAQCHATLRILHEHGKTMFESKAITQSTMLTLIHCRHAQGQRDEAIQHVLNLLETAKDSQDRALLLETLGQFTQVATMK
jgi:tetratricopeptide (TPR) repeat protein